MEVSIKTLRQIYFVLGSTDILTSLNCLTDRDIYIVHSIWKFNLPISEIALKYDYTPNRIRQIYNHAANQLVHLTKTYLKRISNIDETVNENLFLKEKNRQLQKALLKIQSISSENQTPKAATPIPISELDLSHKIANTLAAAEIFTVAQLLEYSREDLLRFRNLGRVSINKIKNALDKLNVMNNY